MTVNRRCQSVVAGALVALWVSALAAATPADALTGPVASLTPTAPLTPVAPLPSVTTLVPTVQMPVDGIASSGSCTHDRHNNGATGIGGDGQGRTGGNEDAQCQGAGLQFIGPAIGQVAAVMGPTIIGATILAPVQTSAGSSAATLSP